MSKTLIRNPSNNPLALPFPFRGALPAGGGVVVDATVAQVRAQLGTGVFELTEVNQTPADAFYLGNLLDPVATQAQQASAIAASNAVARPGRVRLTGLDGSTSPNMTILGASHQAGLYVWLAEIDKQVAAGAGTLTATLNYNHPEGGARQKALAAFALTGTGVFAVAGLPFESNGVGPVVVNNVCAGATGTPAFSVAHCANLVG